MLYKMQTPLIINKARNLIFPDVIFLMAVSEEERTLQPQPLPIWLFFFLRIDVML